MRINKRVTELSSPQRHPHRADERLPIPRFSNVAKPGIRKRLISSGQDRHRGNIGSNDSPAKQAISSLNRSSSRNNRTRASIPETGRRQDTIYVDVDSDSSQTSVAETPLPVPPSRTPTPPTKHSERASRGIKFTDEDHTFFVQTLQWEMAKNSKVTRDKMCTLLSAKVNCFHCYLGILNSRTSRLRIMILEVGKDTGVAKAIL